MVVIDEDEYMDLDAGIEPETLPDLTPEESEEALDMLEQTLPEWQFKRNDVFDMLPVSLGPPDPLPTWDEFMLKVFETADQADIKMLEAEKLIKQKRKERLKLFDACIKQYLNDNCNANHKIKYKL